MLTLAWQRHGPRSIRATGGKGTYRINYQGRAYILTGRGHDGLTMLDLVPARRFGTAHQAREYAAEIERSTVKEAEVSGT